MGRMIGLLALLVIVFAAGGSASARADGCYICTSGSSSYCKNQCAYRGKDTQENRKRCRDAGCKIGGTTSCSTAANIKVCLSDRAPAQPRRYATSFELFESRSVD